MGVGRLELQSKFCEAAPETMVCHSLPIPWVGREEKLPWEVVHREQGIVVVM